MVRFMGPPYQKFPHRRSRNHRSGTVAASFDRPGNSNYLEPGGSQRRDRKERYQTRWPYKRTIRGLVTGHAAPNPVVKALQVPSVGWNPASSLEESGVLNQADTQPRREVIISLE